MSAEADRRPQQALHEAIDAALFATGEAEGGALLGGWVIVYELIPLDGSAASAGHFYGPAEMTTWRALGLIEWTRRFGLTPDKEEP